MHRNSKFTRGTHFINATYLSCAKTGTDRTQWTDKKSNLEAVSQMKWMFMCEGSGEGVAKWKEVKCSSTNGPSSMSMASSSASDASPLPFSAFTRRVKVSMAWEMSVFSRAANILLGSMFPSCEDTSPLLDPFSVELSSSLVDSFNNVSVINTSKE